MDMSMTDSRLTLEIEGQAWVLKDGDVIGRLGTVGGEALRRYDVLSRQHLKVTLKDGQWQIALMPKTGNETLCEGEPMTLGIPVTIGRTCEIQVVTLMMHLTLEDGAPEAEHPAALVTLDKNLHVTWSNRAAAKLLRHELALGTDFLPLLETGATLRVRYALMGLKDGVELEEAEVASRTEDGTPWLVIRAVRNGESLLLALRDVTQERQQGMLVKQAADRLEAKMGALTTLLTAEAFVDGDIAVALPLLVQHAAELLEDTRVSAWLPASRVGTQRTESTPLPFIRRAVAGAGAAAIGDAASLASWPEGGEVSAKRMETLREAGLLDEATTSVWIELLESHGMLVFQKSGTESAWLDFETRLIGLAVALGRQLFSNAERREVLETMQAHDAALSVELTEAEQYVEHRLPAALTKGAVEVDWLYKPCGRLGGDIFGYEWLDENRFAIYIADVMGHGVRSSLHALSLSQTLKLLLARGAGDDPAAWLTALNKEFPMKTHEGLLWTMWCGLYDRRTRALRHASGGHPPALLCQGSKVTELSSEGPVLGAMEEAPYHSIIASVPAGSKLFLFTDGVYEFPVADGDTGTLADFTQAVGAAAGMAKEECAYLKTRAAALCTEPEFPDDFTIVRARFAR